jgi:hypothetical protein
MYFAHSPEFRGVETLHLSAANTRCTPDSDVGDPNQLRRPEFRPIEDSLKFEPNCMAATQWLYSLVSTKVSEKTGILEIACCEMRNLRTSRIC